MEKYSKTYFKLSFIIFITFEILLYFHFINPPYSESGWFYFFWNVRWSSKWEIHTGFILGTVMITIVIISFVYDKFMLRRHYKTHLPDYISKKQKEFDELDNNLDFENL